MVCQGTKEGEGDTSADCSAYQTPVSIHWLVGRDDSSSRVPLDRLSTGRFTVTRAEPGLRVVDVLDTLCFPSVCLATVGSTGVCIAWTLYLVSLSLLFDLSLCLLVCRSLSPVCQILSLSPPPPHFAMR